MFLFLHSTVAAVFLAVLIIRTKGQACDVNPAPANGIKPVAASGYHFSVVANGLTKPRSIQFDDAGNLLVLQVGKGIVSLQLDDAGGVCVWAPSKQTVVSNTAVSFPMNDDGKLFKALIFLMQAQSRNDAFHGWQNTICLGSYRSLFMDL